MKGILAFDLDDPDDCVSHLRATKSLDLALTLWHFQEFLRDKRKHAEDTNVSIEEVCDKFYETMEKYDVNLEKLMS